MKPNDRARLTNALRDHVGTIAADLRAKMRAPGDTRARALQLHADEKVAEDFDVWTDLLSRRAAVLWVLKSVYVRVLEDRGLLTPGRLLDQEAQHLFERLAPHLGETAFLRWVYRDLASPHGGLPELFSPQPAEVALPSDELSRALIAFWRHRDADTGATWSFAEERFEGELMGDLYQELDPVVKDRFALCQTPAFVRAFVLDRTLTPAIETFGADEVRLLDPACGSGHFLIDGLKRLVVATGAKHPDWEPGKVVAHALDRVVGVDLNDYACALARARLIMTAAELAGVTSLADAARFHPHVYWADGLEQVEREEQKPSLQYALFEKVEEKPRATLTRSDVRAALKKVFSTKFHAVVANPPYILERDDARKSYHRDMLGKKRRYVSASGKYSLASPFTERCFQLAEYAGFVGLITSNNFMKREFGKALIESVLARLDLSLVVDTSQVVIPFHDTPTVLIFGRARPPESAFLRVVMGKQSETAAEATASPGGMVWQNIVSRWSSLGFEDSFISVVDVARETMNKHPWSLGGGGAADLKAALDGCATTTLGQLAESIGITCFTLEDDAFVAEREVFDRHGVETAYRRPLVEGDSIRDWTLFDGSVVVFPYDSDFNVLPEIAGLNAERWLWPFKARLSNNKMFGGRTKIDDGLKWYEFGRLTAAKLKTPLTIAFSFVASHNHFVLDRGGKVFNRSAPVIKLPPGTSEDDHYALVGLLNSSVACFWMKQVFFPKGSATHDVSKDGLKPENNTYEFAATGLLKFPLPAGWRDARVISHARALEALAKERVALSPDFILRSRDTTQTAAGLRNAFLEADRRDQETLARMVFHQEELDWTCYANLGLVSQELAKSGDGDVGTLDSSHRPFCVGEAVPWSNLRAERVGVLSQRLATIREGGLISLVENPIYKRLWRGRQGIFGRYDRTYGERCRTAMRVWLAAAIEEVIRARSQPARLDQIVATLQSDTHVLSVTEVLSERPDFSLSRVVKDAVVGDAVPNHRFHVFKPSGLVKSEAWGRTWAEQRRADSGERVELEAPPTYASSDSLKPEFWQLRGKLNAPRERYIAFTEVPGRAGVETLYGWAGWTAQQRVKAILAIDEDLEDASVPLADRIGLLDSAWCLLPDVTREDAAAATRIKAELQALVGPEGPSRELIEDWKKRFPPPTTRATRTKRAAVARVEDDSETEETDGL